MDYTFEELREADGQKVTCYISGDFVDDAVLAVYGGDQVYICQNTHSGASLPSNKKYGYRYSWNIVTDGEDFYEGRDSVTELTLLGKDEEIKPIKFIVTYLETSRDPFKVFTDRESMIKWLSEAVTDRTIRFESIKVFEVVNMKKPLIKVSLKA